MHYTNEDIINLDRITRLKIINAVSGIKAANLIGTINTEGTTNLAIFNSVVHIGSEPPLLGFIARPQTAEVGHTLRNIKSKGMYTINQVTTEFTERAHYTSAKFQETISEFEHCGFTETYIEGFAAPFVKESNLKIGLQLREVIPIPLNGTALVIGEIEHLILPDTTMESGDIDLEMLDSAGISGLNTYYKLSKVARYPYARVQEVPRFDK